MLIVNSYESYYATPISISHINNYTKRLRKLWFTYYGDSQILCAIYIYPNFWEIIQYNVLYIPFT